MATKQIDQISIYCVINGGKPSKGFLIRASPEHSMTDLKKMIKEHRTPALDDIASDALTLWKVSFVADLEQDSVICLDTIVKSELYPFNLVKDVFAEALPTDASKELSKGTVRIIVEPPPPKPPKPSETIKVFNVVRRAKTQETFIWTASSRTSTLQEITGYLRSNWTIPARNTTLAIHIVNLVGTPAVRDIFSDEQLREMVGLHIQNEALSIVMDLEPRGKRFSDFDFNIALFKLATHYW
ncbi:hypothetical protein BGX20_001953 [Mortierella sp. AD010]|nr:hypothetical protein BGX20_001953 [Mortierella sp. AD010]